MDSYIDIPTGAIIATDVSPDDYMADYAADRCEWVRGYVIRMSPVSLKHEGLTTYLRHLLDAYFALRPLGRVVGQPFVMAVEATESRREPDLQVILNENPGQLTDTAMLGPADICIEVVSRESSTRDYGEKFTEYEAGGVREYWLVDPLRNECRFHRLTDAGTYAQVIPTDDRYRSPLLPGLSLHVPTLWRDPLPTFYEVGTAVQAMLDADER